MILPGVAVCSELAYAAGLSSVFPSQVAQAHPECVGAQRARRSKVECNFGRWPAAGFALGC